MSRKRDTDELRTRDRVVSVAPVGTIPAGEEGTVKMVVGQAWTRYWVAFDNGRWASNVDASQVVRADRLEQWRQQQAQAAERAASAAPAAAAEGAATPTAASGSDSRIPEHLLERSRQARARKAAAAAG